MKNNLFLFLLLACSTSITMTMSKKAGNKHHQRRSQNVLWPMTLNQVTKRLNDSHLKVDVKTSSILKTQKNSISTLPSLQEKNLKKQDFRK